MPWTPPPGGVEELHRNQPGTGMSQGCRLATGRHRVWRRLWTPPPIAGGDPPAYDVVRSTDVVDFASGAACIETDDSTDTQVVTSGVPASGQLYFYLVRAENDCGIGSVGQQSGGAPRTAPSCGP